MGLDVRLPVGLLFSAIGLALIAYGLASDPAIYARSLDVNVNLWWGAVLLGFGASMLVLATRQPRPRRRARPADMEEPVAR